MGPQTAPSYLTYCFEAATGTLPTGVCAEGTYEILNSVVTQALTDPMGLNSTLLGPLEAICEAGCVTQLINMVRGDFQLAHIIWVALQLSKRGKACIDAANLRLHTLSRYQFRLLRSVLGCT